MERTKALSFIFANCDRDFTLLDMCHLLDMEEIEGKSQLDSLVADGLLSFNGEYYHLITAKPN